MRSNSSPNFPTLFLADLAEKVVGDRLVLDRNEAEHLRVVRCRPGASVHTTDGRGMRWSGELGIGNRARTLTLVEKAAEFGARGIQPLECERSRSVGDTGRSPAFWSKARSRAIAALDPGGVPLAKRLSGSGGTERVTVLGRAGGWVDRRGAGDARRGGFCHGELILSHPTL